MPPVETATQQIVVEPSQTVPPTASIEPAHTATLTLAVEAIPTAPPTTTPEVSPLFFAPENADDIEELTSLVTSEIGEIEDVTWSPDGIYLAVIGSQNINLLDAASMEIIWRHHFPLIVHS